MKLMTDQKDEWRKKYEGEDNIRHFGNGFTYTPTHIHLHIYQTKFILRYQKTYWGLSAEYYHQGDNCSITYKEDEETWKVEIIWGRKITKNFKNQS